MNETLKEHEILMIMRKVLANIIKDTTPAPGMIHPLKPGTIDDIKNCLALIAAKERELAKIRGVEIERPFFTDARPAAEVVSIEQIRQNKKPVEN